MPDFLNLDGNFEKSEQKAPYTSRDLEIISEVYSEQSSYISSSDQVEIAPGTGRSSVPENLDALFKNATIPISSKFPFYLLELIENLTIYDRHVSFALENITSLAYTDYQVSFSENVPDSQQELMRRHLNMVKDSWYEHSDGLDSLIRDLFSQAGTFGALSYEKVPKRNLSGIDVLVRVNPKNVRFSFDRETNRHAPIQLPNNAIFNKKDTSNSYVKLNTNTYSYRALKRFKSEPYGIPGFVSALEDLVLEKVAIDSFSNMIKRVGMLGFLSVMVKQPKRKANESDSAYSDRLKKVIDDTTPRAEEAMGNGVVVGLEGVHNFEVSGNDIDLKNGESIMKIIKSLVFNGLKQDPNMLGENFSTTETFGRVILAKMSKQIESFQRLVAGAIEDIFVTELVLAGFNPGMVKVEFDKPLISDQKKDAESDKIKIENVIKKRDEGIIDQTQAAQELDYEEPAFPGSIAASSNSPTPNGEEDPNETDDGEQIEMRSTIDALLKKNGKHHTEFNYYVPEGCLSQDSFIETTEFQDKTLTKLNRRYVNSVRSQYSKYSKQSSEILKKRTQNFNETTSKRQWEDAVLFAALTPWNEFFTNEIEDEIEKYVSGVYEFFRKDDSVFTKAENFKKTESFFEIPEGLLDAQDVRLIEFLKSIDRFYLGKFITDDDTIRRVKDWIAFKFENDELPIGPDSPAVEDFTNDFSNQLNLEQYKIRRIIETTMNKSRSFASVKFMDQAEVSQYEVVEVLDSNTCQWCAHMDGMKLEISNAKTSMERQLKSGPQSVPNISPFATSIDIDTFRGFSSNDIQNAGVNVPAYHPHCKGSIVAVL